ncbi:L,D-transpeptidase family protein [Paenibacillus rhizovicinus]|uniref:L,D-transpeptidase family protein n=1 Tax=Paenibacillus rhizovicinus TaxID=2704463 RepID=A0A6C0P3X3_9BACL|nr:L,D-transpeptidase family protein [Paenibacillus rhizovicinus]
MGGRLVLSRYSLKVSSLSIVLLLLWNVLSLTSASAAASKDQLLVINKKTNQLAFYEGGELIKTFSVATGKTRDLTPEGSFKIVNKIKNRPYYKDKIPGGDPRNPLGDRWLGLEVNGTEGTTYAIHGNNKASSIGKYVSAGCIRMKNDEIHWLFPQIELGTRVVITSSKLTFDAIAVQHGYSVLQHYAGKLLLNGKTMALEHQLMIDDSRVFIPMREIFEMLGAKVNWDGASQTVTAVVGSQTIAFQPLASVVDVNGSIQTMTPSKVVDSAVMLPLRDLAELTGYQVVWDGKAQEIRLNS